MDPRPAVTSSGIRRIILQASKRAHVGHIGSALSVTEILAALYNGVMHVPSADDPLRDRFILSKGHAALALYAVLHLKGFVAADDIDQYCFDGGLCGVHPEHHLCGVDFSTGSLGHGLAVGAGVALAARMRGEPFRSFVLVSDAECNEGSLWETVMFAGHHRLGNLFAIVDDNGQQALGRTKDIIDLRPLGDKWRAFGWNVREVDGHDVAALTAACNDLCDRPDAPGVVVARTISGKGVSFMEGKVEWHYLPLSDDQYAQAIRELEASASP